jgi:hypothetical protein
MDSLDHPLTPAIHANANHKATKINTTKEDNMMGGNEQKLQGYFKAVMYKAS